jgi:hypothetical protein
VPPPAICLPQASAEPEFLPVLPPVQERVRSASPQPEPQGLSAQRCLNNHPLSLPICQGLPQSETDSGLAACTGGPAPPAIISRYRPMPLQDAGILRTAGPSLERALAPPLESSWSLRWTRSSLSFLSRLLLLGLSTNPRHARIQQQFGTLAMRPPRTMAPELRHCGCERGRYETQFRRC